MEVVRADIESITASFRVPMFMMGFQPSFSVPPIATVLGILSAAKGEMVTLKDVSIGYTFEYEGRGRDLQKIKEIEEHGYISKTNVIERDFLYGCKLHLYIDDMEFMDYLRRPVFQIALGRSEDIAGVTACNVVALEERAPVIVSGTLIPYCIGMTHPIVSLPTGFTETIPRKPLEVRKYCSIETPTEVERGYYDAERGRGVFIHRKE